VSTADGPGSSDREGDREHPVLEPALHIPEPVLEGGGLVQITSAADSGDPCSISPRVRTETYMRSGGVAAIQSATPAAGWRLRVSDSTLASSR